MAKLSPERDEGSELSTLAKETTPGAILGTAGYMSPEQAKGQPADFRSDQFSLGAIEYEMATGKRAFERDTAAETLTAIIRGDPGHIRSLNPSVPGHMASVIDRCIRKAPADRYASTSEIAKAFHHEGLRLTYQAFRPTPLAAGDGSISTKRWPSSEMIRNADRAPDRLQEACGRIAPATNPMSSCCRQPVTGVYGRCPTRRSP